MRITILTFEGFNELDSFIAAAMLNRVRSPELRALITCPAARATSMNGVVVESQCSFESMASADAVLVGSGVGTRDLVHTPEIMSRIRLDPSRQLIGAQCSGTLILAKLGLLAGVPACTDSKTRPWVEEAGVKVLDEPFFAQANVATAGGCLSSQYLAVWLISRFAGWKAAEAVIHYIAPVGQKAEYVARARAVVSRFVRLEEPITDAP